MLTSLDIAGWCTRSKVVADFDLGFAHEDHVPVQVVLQGVATSRVQAKRLDEAKMLDPDLCSRFQAALCTLPMPTWHVDVETHAKILREQFRQLGSQFFAGDSKPKQARWMTHTTANLIAFKRQVLQLLRHEEDVTERDCIKHELRMIEKMVVAACFQDKRAYYDKVAQQLQEQGEAGNFKAVFHHLGRLSSKRKRQTGTKLQPLPEIDGGDQGPASSFERKQEIFFHQFAQIESADIVTEEELKMKCSRCGGEGPGDIDLKFLPTIEQIGRKLRRMKRGKAPGPDHIVPALYKAGGQVMARHLCSIFHKVALWASEPLQRKTGILTALFKRGDHKDPANYRSIYISDHMAKLYHGCFRDHLNDLYQRQPKDTQMGGRKGKGTDMAHHVLQAFQAKAQVDGVCSAIFFLDLHSVFYAVLRQFLFSEGWNDQVLCRLLHYLNIEPEQIEELRRQSREHDATKHLHPHGVAILKDIFDGANFQMRGIDRIGIPQRACWRCMLQPADEWHVA